MLLVEPGNSELLLPLVLLPLLVEPGNREVELRLMGADADPPPPDIPPADIPPADIPPADPPKLPEEGGAPPCWA